MEIMKGLHDINPRGKKIEKKLIRIFKKLEKSTETVVEKNCDFDSVLLSDQNEKSSTSF